MSNMYIIVKQTSLFPFSKANRACFIPVTETSILDRSTEWSSFWVLDWDLPWAVPLLPAVILNDISYRPLKGYISTYGFNITPFISKLWRTGLHNCRMFLKVTTKHVYGSMFHQNAYSSWCSRLGGVFMKFIYHLINSLYASIYCIYANHTFYTILVNMV